VCCVEITFVILPCGPKYKVRPTGLVVGDEYFAYLLALLTEDSLRNLIENNHRDVFDMMKSPTEPVGGRRSPRRTAPGSQDHTAFDQAYNRSDIVRLRELYNKQARLLKEVSRDHAASEKKLTAADEVIKKLKGEIRHDLYTQVEVDNETKRIKDAHKKAMDKQKSKYKTLEKKHDNKSTELTDANRELKKVNRKVETSELQITSLTERLAVASPPAQTPTPTPAPTAGLMDSTVMLTIMKACSDNNVAMMSSCQSVIGEKNQKKKKK
jgi:hypothetical protein